MTVDPGTAAGGHSAGQGSGHSAPSGTEVAAQHLAAAEGMLGGAAVGMTAAAIISDPDGQPIIDENTETAPKSDPRDPASLHHGVVEVEDNIDAIEDIDAKPIHHHTDHAKAEAPEKPPEKPPTPLHYAHVAWWRVVTDHLMLLLLTLILIAPGVFSLPVTDRDEARFVQASRQMTASHDYVDIRFQDEARYKKPVGIYWLQSAAVSLSGEGDAAPIGVYRLPSQLGILLAVFATWWIGAWLKGPNTGLLAALLLGSSLQAVIEAHIAKTDAMLLASVVVAMAAFTRAYVAPLAITRLKGAAFVFWSAIGVGILLKGPLILLFIGLPIAITAILDRSPRAFRRLYPLAGIAWAALIVAPWLVLIIMKSGTAFFQEAIGQDLMGKIADGQESHGAPPGTYLLAMWLTFFPAVAFLPAAIPYVFRTANTRDMRLLLAWIVPGWIIFEIAATKLPHYVLPFYPALALVVAMALTADPLSLKAKWKGYTTLILPLLTAILAIGLNGAYIYLEHRVHPVGLSLGVLAIAAVLVGWRWSFRTGKPLPIVGTGLIAAAMIYTMAFQQLLPNVSGIWASERLADAVAAVKAECPAGPIVSLGYTEPSAVFRLGTEVLITDSADAAAAKAKAAPCAILLVEQHQAVALTTALAGLPVTEKQRFAARNLDGFEPMEFAVLISHGQ